MQLLDRVKVGDNVWVCKSDGKVIQCEVKKQESEWFFYGEDSHGNSHHLCDMFCFDDQSDALIASIESLEFKIFQNKEMLRKIDVESDHV